MGADIRLTGRTAVVRGAPLRSAHVCSTDLRGGAAMVVAALAARGETEITCLSHLDRGYDDLTNCLAAVGASIERKTL